MPGKNKQILGIAVPSIISNITVPLLGLADVTIVGHLGSPIYIGAIAVGGMLFNMIYWIFGFLRMGTSGMTSQAFGRNDPDEVMRLLMRSTGAGLIIAIVLIALQCPISRLAFALINATPKVEEYAQAYFSICIWGAPAVLGLYGISGWFIGMQNSQYPMLVAITQNVINITASLVFVFLFGLKVEGVALGTLVAQYAGLFMAIYLWQRNYGELYRRWQWRDFICHRAMARFFAVNCDIFLRTLCLVSVTVFFTSAGSSQGDVILAVNTLLMQLFTLFSYIMDGFAYAGEALGGRYYGAGDVSEFKDTIRKLFGWGCGIAAVFTLLYAVGGQDFLGLLTNETSVIQASSIYYYWALAFPFAGFAAFLLDGIFIGITATCLMLRSMFTASVSFFGIYYATVGSIGNHALWLGFIVYLALRGIMQLILGRHLLKGQWQFA